MTTFPSKCASTIPMSSSITKAFICSTITASMPSTMIASTAPQLSPEWFALRKSKITASTFATALGFWKGGNRRADLWRDKVFGQDSEPMPPARSAMDWGVLHEPTAVDHYKRITGRDVSFMGLAAHADEALNWLGASPDGLVGPLPGGGILEVKCPYNNGNPEMGRPWSKMPFYYMPQVQGLTEILDREWVDLYCWTLNGSTLFRVVRDRSYWELMLEVLHEFWWGCVVPAREAVRMGREDIARFYEPAARHRLTGLVVAQSMKLAAEARIVCKEANGHVEFYG